jgi:hypothetical protein
VERFEYEVDRDEFHRLVSSGGRGGPAGRIRARLRRG